MKWLLRKLSKRMQNYAARFALAFLFGMLELYGYKQTGKDALSLINDWRKSRHVRRNKNL
jgi:hypothetical protein